MSNLIFADLLRNVTVNMQRLTWKSQFEETAFVFLCNLQAYRIQGELESGIKYSSASTTNATNKINHSKLKPLSSEMSSEILPINIFKFFDNTSSQFY